MTVKIVTDSVSDIPSELANSLDITMVPLTVNFGVESFLDGVEQQTGDIKPELRVQFADAGRGCDVDLGQVVAEPWRRWGRPTSPFSSRPLVLGHSVQV